MKKKIMMGLMLLSLLASVVSCDKESEGEEIGTDRGHAVEKGKDQKEDFRNDLIIDWYPIVFHFRAQNSNGDDLLDSTSANFAADGLSIEFKGRVETFKLQSSLSKAYMPYYDGIKLRQYEYEGRPHFGEYYIELGEFDGADNFDDDFIVTWKDGSKDVVHFKRVHKGGLDVDDSWTYNGKEFECIFIK